MNLLQLFQKRKPKDHTKENMEIIRQRIGRSQEAVFKAIQEINHPVNGLAIARHMAVDSASVTPRLAELVKKGKIKVAYSKKGLDGVWRKFYVVNDN